MTPYGLYFNINQHRNVGYRRFYFIPYHRQTPLARLHNLQKMFSQRSFHDREDYQAISYTELSYISGFGNNCHEQNITGILEVSN